MIHSLSQPREAKSSLVTTLGGRYDPVAATRKPGSFPSRLRPEGRGRFIPWEGNGVLGRGGNAGSDMPALLWRARGKRTKGVERSGHSLRKASRGRPPKDACWGRFADVENLSAVKEFVRRRCNFSKEIAWIKLIVGADWGVTIEVLNRYISRWKKRLSSPHIGFFDSL